MRVPTAEELAAIAVAYLAVTRQPEPQPSPSASPWALAGRLPALDGTDARAAARNRSRWNAAGRLRG